VADAAVAARGPRSETGADGGGARCAARGGAGRGIPGGSRRGVLTPAGTMSASPTPAETPDPPPDRRTIRTYARREDADRAFELLKEHGIEATVQEFRVSDPDDRTATVSRGCVLAVAPADAAAAARLLMRMPPSESAGRTGTDAAAPPSRRPRPLAPRRPLRQSNALWIL